MPVPDDRLLYFASRSENPESRARQRIRRRVSWAAVYAETIGYHIIDALRDAGLAITRRR